MPAWGPLIRDSGITYGTLSPSAASLCGRTASSTQVDLAFQRAWQQLNARRRRRAIDNHAPSRFNSLNRRLRSRVGFYHFPVSRERGDDLVGRPLRPPLSFQQRQVVAMALTANAAVRMCIRA